MSITITIPEDIVHALKLPAMELKQELDKELALSLYQRGVLSLGKARQLAKLSKWEFQQELQQRKILSHYSPEEMNEDIHYARKRSLHPVL